MNYGKTQRIYKTIMLVFLVALITSLITSILVYKYGMPINNIKYIISNDTNVDENIISKTLSNFREVIDKNFLGEVDDEKLLEGAIKGYIQGLDDEYSEYFTKEELEEYKIAALGNYTGIGIYMVKDTERNVIVVLSPIKGAPAEKAGILPGDIISKIDGVTYTGEQMTEASNNIKKGEIGTKVKLEIIRETEVLNIEVLREEIKINHVESKVLENNIGYLSISTFDEGCSEEFKTKMEELNTKNVKSIIIDLRNNGGGIVDEAISIAELFTNKNETLLITVDKNGKEEITKAKQNKKYDTEIVVLTNENTASASEILAGVLKEKANAKLVGAKTYGKGVIQQLITLKDGSGLKLTTNEYYTPNKEKINKVGITPDELVELPEELQNQITIDEDKDTQLKKAMELLK